MEQVNNLQNCRLHKGHNQVDRTIVNGDTVLKHPVALIYHLFHIIFFPIPNATYY
jgi:hypothetical protein